VQGSAEALQAIVTFEVTDDPLGVLERLRAMWEGFGDEVLAPALFAYASPYEARMCFHLGREQWAAEVVERLLGRFGETGEAWLVHALLAMHQHDHDTAATWLRHIFSAPSACSVRNTVVEAWVLETERCLVLGSDRADRAMQNALDAARLQRIHRPIAIASAPARAIAAKLLRASDQWTDAALLAAVTTDVHDETARLTPRELEVLRQLRWRHEAVVEHTINEIAEALFISRNTAKSHLRSLYRKLGVTNRSEAVEAAERRGLS